MHMTRAFILARESDMPVARACQARMRSLGWQADIMIDPTEWTTPPDDVVYGYYSTHGRGIYGNSCAKAIMDGMLANSQAGEVLMKMDCDIWLSRECADWLAEAGQAKSMRIMYNGKTQAWGGIWSATREHVEAARIAADTIDRCNCAEAWLNMRALYLVPPSIKVKAYHVTQWQDGDERGYCATLPINLRHDRVTEGLKLFDTAP